MGRVCHRCPPRGRQGGGDLGQEGENGGDDLIKDGERVDEKEVGVWTQRKESKKNIHTTTNLPDGDKVTIAKGESRMY